MKELRIKMLIFRKLKSIKSNLIQDESAENFYSQTYGSINATAIDGSLSSKVLHQGLEIGMKKRKFTTILELGGNIGEHVKFVKCHFDKYICSDLSIPKKGTEKSSNSKVSYEIQDAESLTFENNSVDRIILTCILHHLKNPEIALQNTRRVIKPDGVISIALPNDPGIIYRLLRAITTLRNAKKVGKKTEIQLIHAREHRNHYLSLEWIIRETFAEDEILKASFPFPFFSYNLNAMTIYQITVKK
jgi:SAM-dependent methyltransferase